MCCACCVLWRKDVAWLQVASGKLKVWWNRPAKSSTLTLFYSNSESGPCTLDVTAPQGGASIEGSPVQINIKPDTPSAARCAAVARSNKRVMTAETGTLTAGVTLLEFEADN